MSESGLTSQFLKARLAWSSSLPICATLSEASRAAGDHGADCKPALASHCAKLDRVSGILYE